MVFRTLGLCLLLFSTLSFGQGRSPAVEDFVGIEIEEAQVTPQGTESLFNLEQDINKIEAQKNKPVQKKHSRGPDLAENKSWSITTIVSIALSLGLPLILWFMMMAHLKKKAKVESALNIEVLEKYRKEREKKSAENFKKAS